MWKSIATTVRVRGRGGGSPDRLSNPSVSAGLLPHSLLSPAWQVLVLGDGSPTRHLGLLTGLPTSVDVFATDSDGAGGGGGGGAADGGHDAAAAHKSIAALPPGAPDGAPPEVSLIARPLVRRQVWLKSSDGQRLAYACSWWGAEDISRHLKDAGKPIGATMAARRTELYRDIIEVFEGFSAPLDDEFGEVGPYWGRHYVFWREGRPLCLILEVFSSRLQRWLGPASCAAPPIRPFGVPFIAPRPMAAAAASTAPARGSSLTSAAHDDVKGRLDALVSVHQSAARNLAKAELAVRREWRAWARLFNGVRDDAAASGLDPDEAVVAVIMRQLSHDRKKRALLHVLASSDTRHGARCFCCALSYLSADTDVNVRDGSGMTPLHHVCSQNTRSTDTTAVRALLARGATHDCVNSFGRTPYNLAQVLNKPSITRLLEQHATEQPLTLRSMDVPWMSLPRAEREIIEHEERAFLCLWGGAPAAEADSAMATRASRRQHVVQSLPKHVAQDVYSMLCDERIGSLAVSDEVHADAEVAPDSRVPTRSTVGGGGDDVSTGDDRTPRRHAVRVISYNVLADGRKWSLSGRHSYCPSEHLQWTYRGRQLMCEIHGYLSHASTPVDVFCLQEVTPAMYHDGGLAAFMAAAGFDGHFYAVAHPSNEASTIGSATFWRRAAFAPVADPVDVSYRDYVRRCLDATDAAPAARGTRLSEALRAVGRRVTGQVVSRRNSAIVLTLRHMLSGVTFVVANTHMPWFGKAMRAADALILSHHMQVCADAVAGKRRPIVHVCCGDLNDSAASSCVSLLRGLPTEVGSAPIIADTALVTSYEAVTHGAHLSSRCTSVNGTRADALDHILVGPFSGRFRGDGGDGGGDDSGAATPAGGTAGDGHTSTDGSSFPRGSALAGGHARVSRVLLMPHGEDMARVCETLPTPDARWPSDHFAVGVEIEVTQEPAVVPDSA